MRVPAGGPHNVVPGECNVDNSAQGFGVSDGRDAASGFCNPSSACKVPNFAVEDNDSSRWTSAARSSIG